MTLPTTPPTPAPPTKTIVITQNTSLMREAFGEKIYRKVCTECGTGIRARSKGKRVCPRCGGRLRKATKEEKATDKHE